MEIDIIKPKTGVEEPPSDVGDTAAPELTGFRTSDKSRSMPRGSHSEGVDNAAGSADEPSPQELFEVLSNQRRRHVLYYLKHASPETELGTLATQIAAWETDQPIARVSGEERKRVYTSLQQVHLPKMDEANIVAFDKRSGTIDATSSLADIELDPIPCQRTVPWHRYYLALGGLNSALVGATLLGVWPVTMVPPLAGVAAGVVALLVLSVAHMQASG